MQNFGVTKREHYLAINEWGWVGYEELCRSGGCYGRGG